MLGPSQASNESNSGFSDRERSGSRLRRKFSPKNGLELKHVAEIFRAGGAQAAVDIERHVIEADLAPEGAPQLRRHLRAGQDLTGDADPLANRAGAATEQTIGALADVLRCDARKLDAPEQQSEHKVSVWTLRGPMPK